MIFVQVVVFSGGDLRTLASWKRQFVENAKIGIGII